MTIQSTINNSGEDDTESDPNINPKVATYTTNGDSPHKLILNRIVPNIIPGAIRLIDQTTTEDVAGIEDTLDARQTVLLKEIVTDATHSGAHIFRNPRDVSRTGRNSTMPQDRNTAVAASSLTSPVQFFTVPPTPQAGIGTKISSI